MNSFGNIFDIKESDTDKHARLVLLYLCELIISWSNDRDKDEIKDWIESIIRFEPTEKISDVKVIDCRKIHFLLPLLICTRGRYKFSRGVMY